MLSKVVSLLSEKKTSIVKIRIDKSFIGLLFKQNKLCKNRILRNKTKLILRNKTKLK